MVRRAMKKVVVTGGAGFIGSHLAEGLVARGYHVTVLDDLSTGKMENIAHLVANNKAEFIQGSITDLPLLQKLFKGVEYVFHEAALARVPRSIAEPLTCNDVNITGTLKVLLAARDNGVKKVVYASSSSVYGETDTLPEREDMPTNPLSPYALAKLAAEHYCNIFRHIYGLPTASLRYFNVYGTRLDPESQYATVIPMFIRRLARNQAPVIYGDGEQTRDFTYIEDVVQANVAAAENSAEGVYNIGSGERVTINHLARLLINLMGKNLQPIYEKARPADPRHTLADISKARGFGYKSQWKLEDGLGDLIKEFN
jgi:UDP-glucose 4-epimerase